MEESTVDSRDTTFARARAWLSEWVVLFIILGIALFLRVGYMTGLGYRGDLEDTQRWMNTIQAHGLFNFYATEKGLLYPPLATWNLGLLVGLKKLFIPGSSSLDEPAFAFLLKIPAVVAELAIIVAFYVWQRKRRLLCYSVAALLAVSPVMVATSAWWGQTDAIFTAFVVFALLALNRGRSVIAWLLFALAILTKQQSVVLLPLMLILSYQRYGAKTLARGIAVCAVVAACISAPFVLQSGLSRTKAPNTEDVGIFPVTSLHALNFWYL